MTGREISNNWTLWVDWSIATGHDHRTITDDALDAFEAAIPGKRRAYIQRAARSMGLAPQSQADPWKAPEAGWVDLESALGRCAAYGWPAAVRGRRDAWILILTRRLRLDRRRASEARGRDLPRLIVRIPEPAPGRTCERCIAARWLHVVRLQFDWSRNTVREHVWAVPSPSRNPRAAGSARPCDGSCSDLDRLARALPGHIVLAPAIDQHGWWADWRPLSTRAVTSIMATRCSGDGSAPAADPAPAAPLHPVMVVAEDAQEASTDDEKSARLDAAIAAADAVNARIEALLAEYGG